MIGVDIDADYVARAQTLIANQNAGDHVTVLNESVYDYVGGPFDAVYFSGSFMLMPDPEKALSHVAGMLKKDGTATW